MDDFEDDELGVVEQSLDCPYCGEPITMLVDPSESEQEYVEDCEVCCNPIAVHVRASRGTVISFDAQQLP